MDEPITIKQATEISRVSRAIAEGRRDTEKASNLIEQFESTSLQAVTITVTPFPGPNDYTCEVSAASAICLLREAIEQKQQQIDKYSDWLRTALNQ